MIRFFDIFLSTFGLIILSPVLLVIAIWIKMDSPGPIFYRQSRVGKNGSDFKLIKFRSMYIDSDKKDLLTIGNNDNRITKFGYCIRKYKLDELPQLINVLIGNMSIVGPRPEVRKYVDLYSENQQIILSVKPGITDYSSIIFRNENELLAQSSNPEEFYVKFIMPKKIELNMIYIRNPNFFQYLRIIILTIFSANKRNESFENIKG